MNLRIFICIFFIQLGLISSARPDGRKVSAGFLSDPALKGSSCAILVVESSGGKPLVSENSDRLLAPASTLKLVTSAASLELLGADFCFSTALGCQGTIDAGILAGSLVIKGGGDPTLGSGWFTAQSPQAAFFDKWIEEIRKRGISEVRGDLVMDVSFFDEGDMPGSWAWEDIGNYYGAGPSALTFFDNQIKLFFDSPGNPGEPVTLVRCDPDVKGIVWRNELKSSAVNRDLAYVYGSPWGGERLIEGSIPAGRKSFAVKASMPRPPVVLGNILKEKLAAAGIEVTGSVRTTNEPQAIQPVSTVQSPPLREIVKVLNHESVNLFADHLVLQMAGKATGTGSFRAGLELLHDFWKKHGVKDTFFIEDGSGLSRFNAISATQLVSVLMYMSESENSQIFKSTLPSAGKGTLGGFRTADFPGTTLQCKSGSMDRVRAYAGYLTCLSGREVTFAIICNNFPGTQTEVGRKMQILLSDIRKEY